MKRVGVVLVIVIVLVIVGILVLSAGGEDDPEYALDEIEVADEGVVIDFSNADDFEIDAFEDGSRLIIENGEYVLTATNADRSRYLVGKSIWGEDEASSYPMLKNVMIEVEAQPQVGDDENWYGVMCRVGADGSGYAFLIGADGFWSIALSDGRSLDTLEDWRQSDAIEKGNASNAIQVYCVDDYLALYVNGKFVGDHRDDKLNNVGGFAVVAGGIEENEVTVVFDDLTVREANLEGKPNTPVPTPRPTDTPEAIDVPPIGDSEVTPPALDSFGPVVTEEPSGDNEE